MDELKPLNQTLWITKWHSDMTGNSSMKPLKIVHCQSVFPRINHTLQDPSFAPQKNLRKDVVPQNPMAIFAKQLLGFAPETFQAL